MKVIGKLSGAGLLAVLASPAMAHTGGELSALAGALHPLQGVDHLLAMLGVGVLASCRPVHEGVMIVAAFLMSLFAASLLGMAGYGVGFAEPGILVSLVVFGGLIAFGKSLPAATVAAVTGLFGLAHGFAHGVEAMGATPLYLAAFLATSAGLHGAGMVFGRRLVTSDLGRLATGAFLGAGGLVLSLA